MDTEYVIDSMFELGELTSLDYELARHHRSVYSELRRRVDNNQSFEDDLIYNLADDTLNSMEVTGQYCWALKAAPGLSYARKFIRERIAHSLVRASRRDEMTTQLILPGTSQIILPANPTTNTFIDATYVYYNGIIQRLSTSTATTASAIYWYNNSTTTATTALSNFIQITTSNNEVYMATACGNAYMHLQSQLNQYKSEIKAPAIKKSTKNSIKRALKLMLGLGFESDVKVFLNGGSIEVYHEDSPLKFVITKYPNSLIQKTDYPGMSTPFKLELYTKSEVKIANLCVYMDKTPVLDQVLGLIMFIKSGSEEHILSQANFFSVSQDEEALDLFTDRYPALSSKVHRKRTLSETITIATQRERELSVRSREVEEIIDGCLPQVNNLIIPEGVTRCLSYQ